MCARMHEACGEVVCEAVVNFDQVFKKRFVFTINLKEVLPEDYFITGWKGQTKGKENTYMDKHVTTNKEAVRKENN